MKLRRLFAAFLAVMFVITASPLGTIHAVTEEPATESQPVPAPEDNEPTEVTEPSEENGDDLVAPMAEDAVQTLSAPNAEYMLWSATVAKNTAGTLLKHGNPQYMFDDKVTVETLLETAAAQFNVTGSEWMWFSYQVNASAKGTYTLGVKTTNCGAASYVMPMVVDGQVHPLSFTATGQQVTAEVELSAGKHTVVMFMPMPLNEQSAQNNKGKDFPWCNVQSVIVDSDLTVSKPTVADVEAGLVEPVKEDTKISAPDTNYVLRSAAVKYTSGSSFLELGATAGVYGDAPLIDTLLTKAPGQFNKAGQEWPWIAYKISAPADGTYTLGVDTNNARKVDGVYNYKIPMVIDNQLHVLHFTQASQLVTAEVALTKGEHIVTVFWPMPQNEEEAGSKENWFKYIWMNLRSLTVDYELTVENAPTAAEVEACFPEVDTVISATDTGVILHSAAMDIKDGIIARKDQASMGADSVSVETLYSKAHGQFNKTGEEWSWFAYKVNAPAAGTYTLGVKTTGSKYASYQIPMCIDGEVYALQYTAKAQEVTAQVNLSAGEHVVVMFMPMPATTAAISGNVWNDYHWSDVASVTVDRNLTASKPTVEEVEACFAPVSISATDTGVILHSAAMDIKDGIIARKDQASMGADSVSVETLYSKAYGQFNKTGEEWSWFAYKVNAPTAGTYTLGVKTTGSKYASYQIPMCIDGEVYALKYTAKAQEVTAQVELTAGEHVVVMFMPMPATAAAISGNVWNDYHWSDVASVTVARGLKVTKPTVAEVEACFPKVDTVVPAVDTNYILHSATIDVQDGIIGRTDQATLKLDRPSIETLYDKAYGEFNKAGEEWSWFAYKVTASTAGTYTLSLKTAGSKFASYQMPMCINGEVYTLSFTATAQQVSAEVALKAGENVVVVFMPMPVDPLAISGNEWNDYHWANVESVTVGHGLTVSKPTVAEVEACFPDPVADSPLTGKSLLFVGDSITYGIGDDRTSNVSWVSEIGDTYRMDWTNGGVKGATVSYGRAKVIRHQLMAHAGNTYDYVIMQGGINDAMTERAIGTVSDSWNVADFDRETFAGALETQFYYAYENYAGARFGYIITYATPNTTYEGFTAGEMTRPYYEAAKAVCDKWGIPYIDLYDGTAPDGRTYSFDILQLDKSGKYLIDYKNWEIHLNSEGYELISPYIAAWMETLTVNENPIPAAFSGKHIDANDAEKVLYGGFTAMSFMEENAARAGLQDRVNTGMAEDGANLEMLPYAKDMLGDWAFAAIAVKVPADGTYTIGAEMSAKAATQMGMLVDGELYTLHYEKSDGYFQFMGQDLALTAGTHYIVFTAAMPNNDNELDGEAWDIYPWTNIAAIVVEEGVEVLAKPTLEDVTSTLKPYEPFYTRVEAEDSEYVVYNNYNTTNEANSKASGGYVVGGAWNSTFNQTFGELEAWLNAKGNAYVEYAVMAPADGEYEIRVAYLAGSSDKTIEKPYIAVIVNDTTYKAQFTKDWNQIDKIKLTVELKEGLNIIRCTSMTIDQEIYGVKGWINQDFIDLDTRLTPVKHSSVVVEAESVRFYNRLKVQAGGKDEAASGKVLGSADRKYVKGLRLTLSQYGRFDLNQVPFVSLTVTAPQTGYYPISVYMAGDGRLKQCTVGMILDGEMTPVTYTRTDKTTAGARVDALVYLTAGDHTITFTTPLPVNAGDDVNYDYLWANFDYIELFNGLTYAKTQKVPAFMDYYARVEVEGNAMYNLSKNNGTAIGDAYYKSLQSVQEMLDDRIDSGRTPYIELTVDAKKAGSYVLYLNVAAGMTAGSSYNSTYARFVTEVNGTRQARSVLASKSTEWTVIPLWVNLEAGSNTIRVTHMSSDSQYGGTTWIDFDYIEMPSWVAANLEFQEVGEVMEAEEALFTGYYVEADSSYSRGQYLGSADYGYVDENDITFEKLNPADLDELPSVTYTFEVEKAGTYPVTIGFAAGLYNHTTKEIAEGKTGGFAVIVNGTSKQLVEYQIASSNSKMSRVVLLELQEGENEITVTTTLSEYIVDHTPRNDETYRLIWVDHDFLQLSNGMSRGAEPEKYGLGDSDYNHGQIDPKAPAADPGEATEPTEPQPEQAGISVGTWIGIGAGVVLLLILLLLLLLFAKKRKQDKEA